MDTSALKQQLGPFPTKALEEEEADGDEIRILLTY